MLEKLFSPVSVAVVGASRTPGKVGHDILANLVAGGYEGEIIPVNPAGGTLFERQVYTRLTDYRGHIDQVIIAVPGQSVLDVVRDAITRKAGAIIVISAGFRETGEDGSRLQSELADICRRGGARLLGPNCLGLINTEAKLNSSFAGGMPRPGSIAVFSQSGALCTAMLDLAENRHIGLSKLISIGNKADLSEIEMLTALSRDEQTRVIVGYLEDISAGDEFIKAAEDASNRKPVIILKSGTTSAGQKAAASHTGVLSGADTAYGAAFKRSGVCRADTFDSLFDYATAFNLQPLPKGDRILIITNAGGPGTMAADAVEKSGLQVAILDRNVSTALRSHLPAAASLANPIDVLGDAGPERYVAALRAAQQDNKVDAILILLTPQAMTQPRETALAILEHMDGSKPVLASFMGGKDVMPGRR
ncbi:MAG: acetate--CoA ligase family protein, partial [Desulfobulbales bacterium]